MRKWNTLIILLVIALAMAFIMAACSDEQPTATPELAVEESPATSEVSEEPEPTPEPDPTDTPEPEPSTAEEPAENQPDEQAEAGDEGTLTLISDYIQQQEKTAWMLSSFLG